MIVVMISNGYCCIHVLFGIRLCIHVTKVKNDDNKLSAGTDVFHYVHCKNM